MWGFDPLINKSILVPSTFSSVIIGNGAEACSRQPLSIVMRRDEERACARLVSLRTIKSSPKLNWRRCQRHIHLIDVYWRNAHPLTSFILMGDVGAKVYRKELEGKMIFQLLYKLTRNRKLLNLRRDFYITDKIKLCNDRSKKRTENSLTLDFNIFIFSSYYFTVYRQWK